MAKAVCQSLSVLLAGSGGGGRRFAPVDIAVVRHDLYIECRLSFARTVAGGIIP